MRHKVLVRHKPDGTKTVEAVEVQGPVCSSVISPFVKGKIVISDDPKPEFYAQSDAGQAQETVQGLGS